MHVVDLESRISGSSAVLFLIAKQGIINSSKKNISTSPPLITNHIIKHLQKQQIEYIKSQTELIKRESMSV